MKTQIEYITNPEKRCMYCKGREVRTFLSGKLIDVNLEEPLPNKFRCKNVKECQQNLEAENTSIIVSENGYKIVKDFDKVVLEVEINKEIYKADKEGDIF